MQRALTGVIGDTAVTLSVGERGAPVIRHGDPSRAGVVISRAAMLSSAAQARIMSTISVLVRRTTTMPRRGSCWPWPMTWAST